MHNAPTLSRREIFQDGEVVAWVAPDAVSDKAGTRLHVQIEICSGHHDPRFRGEVLDALLDYVEVAHADSLTVTIPRGDRDLLAALSETFEVTQTHPAGSTCLIEADL